MSLSLLERISEHFIKEQKDGLISIRKIVCDYNTSALIEVHVLAKDIIPLDRGQGHGDFPVFLSARGAATGGGEGIMQGDKY